MTDGPYEHTLALHQLDKDSGAERARIPLSQSTRATLVDEQRDMVYVVDQLNRLVALHWLRGESPE